VKKQKYELNELLFGNKVDAYKIIKGEFIAVDKTGCVWSEKSTEPLKTPTNN
jgi:hypothetical protein